MLAFMDEARQSEFLSTIANAAQRARLEEELPLARRHGYATSRSEIFVGTVAVSAPYFDQRGQVVGSVGLYGPNARISDQKLIEYSKLVRKAGRQISVLLGYQEAERPEQASS
jgi:DNA-binding IclR family transcriptional regulator